MFIVHRLCAKLFTKFSAVSLAAVMIVIYAVIFAATKIFIPASFLGLGLFCIHCPYFTLGVFAYQCCARLSGFLASIPANVAMMILFMVIAPCWYLTSPNPISLRYGELVYKAVKIVSAIPGIFLTLLAVKIIVRKNFMRLTPALCFVGKLTLGIYAIHGRFLGLFPPVIVPLSASIILTVIIGRIPVIRTLLLGNMLDYPYPTSRKEL